VSARQKPATTPFLEWDLEQVVGLTDADLCTNLGDLEHCFGVVISVSGDPIFEANRDDLSAHLSQDTAGESLFVRTSCLDPMDQVSREVEITLRGSGSPAPVTQPHT
jgi:hypothetical protein